jgi:hypothetical protein
MSASSPATRQELIDWCFRRLGDDVIEINVSDQQAEDRIDEAFQFYRDYHFDAIEQVYLKQQITQQDITNQYIELNDLITGVARVLPFTARTRGIDLFDVRYQILLNDIYSIQSTDIIYYNQVKTQLNLLNDLLVGQKPIRFNRHQNRLYIDMDWSTDVAVGEFIIVECFRVIDPNTYPDVYNDSFLKRYAYALIKMQWGNNLKKFEGVQLPGGVTLNGQKIFDEAFEEIQALKEEADSRYTLPTDMFVG